MTGDIVSVMAEIDAEVAADAEQALEQKRAALWIQGEQAYTYWAASASSPIGRANSRQRLATATQAGVDPLVMVIHWLNGLAGRARALQAKAAAKEAKRATR